MGAGGGGVCTRRCENHKKRSDFCDIHSTQCCMCWSRALFAYDALLQMRHVHEDSSATADASVGLARALQREGLSHVLHLCLDRPVTWSCTNQRDRGVPNAIACVQHVYDISPPRLCNEFPNPDPHLTRIVTCPTLIVAVFWTKRGMMAPTHRRRS